MSDYRRLAVWQRSYQFVLQVYRDSSAFPTDERFGLTNQLRRAAASVPLNIVEGSGRASDNEYRQFLRIARGSSNETTCLLMLARDLGYLASNVAEPLVDESEQLGAMLTGLIRALARKPANG